MTRAQKARIEELGDLVEDQGFWQKEAADKAAAEVAELAIRFFGLEDSYARYFTLGGQPFGFDTTQFIEDLRRADEDRKAGASYERLLPGGGGDDDDGDDDRGGSVTPIMGGGAA